jgi:hypothetical protein
MDCTTATSVKRSGTVRPQLSSCTSRLPKNTAAVIPDAAKRRSAIHTPVFPQQSAPGLWIAALASLGRNDGGEFFRSLLALQKHRGDNCCARPGRGGAPAARRPAALRLPARGHWAFPPSITWLSHRRGSTRSRWPERTWAALSGGARICRVGLGRKLAVGELRGTAAATGPVDA